MEEIMQREEQVFAFDVPLELSADEAARLIDAIVPEGFYPWQPVMWPGAGMRVYCKRSKASKPAELAEATLEATKAVNDAEDAKGDAAIAEILAASRSVTVGSARVRLGRLGFRRGTHWVAEALIRAKAMRRANL